MKKFMDESFLLKTETAKLLYDNYASKLPIIDYHCHISPKEMAENKSYRNITELWLGGDHYKWRAIRSCGVPEKLERRESIRGSLPPVKYWAISRFIRAVIS